MITYLRHKAELLRLESELVECKIQKSIWMEINDTETQFFYQTKINECAFKKENYLNNLLVLLTKTEITQQNIQEIKCCYQLIEQHSKSHYSLLFKAHLNKTIENYQKKYGDLLLKNQFKKAVEIEKIISNLESAA
ncbi:hypothetical protein P3875_11465 [Myroides sp. JBRI-B21084]|uniref:hypothetical protein n=1 Tax=Myroides sp. JBRI-B21084 TaxID=3119977 RepID=UPI0026E1E0B6|nr:hypothetical protein [Paenimyroides cloacae]WKW46376.1 hypothetical protein P3875_11465 [Paenimyroides cloacae]